jgi:hypothetical protein
MWGRIQVEFGLPPVGPVGLRLSELQCRPALAGRAIGLGVIIDDYMELLSGERYR